MWFKLTYSLADMFIQRPGPEPETVIDLGEDREIKFWTFEDKNIRPHLCCDAVLRRALNAETLSIFESLSKRILPEESRSKVMLPYLEAGDEVIDANGNIRPNRWVSLKLMPARFQEQYAGWQNSLSELVTSFVKTIRWVQATAGNQRPFGQIGYYWSVDKTEWQTMPSSFGVMIEQPRGINMSKTAVEEARDIWLSGQREPLAQELIREAFDVATGNPRSGLLIGLSALETGLKEYIAFRVENSDIILEKLPAPPVITILQEILPALHKSLSIQAKEFPLGKAEADDVKKWVLRRNRLAHGVEGSIDSAKLKQFLALVRSLLYTLDYYRDSKWAKPYMAKDALGTYYFLSQS